MSIQGTLETFNLRELLQMLSFNQKVGTLVLSTDGGPRTIHVDRGEVTFVEGDPEADEALYRVLERRELVDADRLARGRELAREQGQALGTALVELGALKEEDREAAWTEAGAELFLDLQLATITHFEFADGQVLTPDGQGGEPIEPRLIVDSLLLDLTRKMDQWQAYGEDIASEDEIYEGTGIAVDLVEALEEHEVETELAERIIPHLNGYRTLQDVVAASSVDRLTVRQVVAILLREGGLRPVSTEDLGERAEGLLHQGDAATARTVLRRAVEREDAPPALRLRLAEALERSGHPLEAAAQLDHFVDLAEDARPIDLFDALDRAAALRGHDGATTARVCDYYLRNRPWLRERHAQALQALRKLTSAAVAERQPIEAAERLKEFIHHGDAPGEDLLVLADLYVSAGARAEAADALFRRAEDLLVAGRVAPARDLLHRTVQLDTTRGDARSRLYILEGQERKRRRRRRITAFLLLLSLLMLGAGASWYFYNEEAGRSVRGFRERAEQAMDLAERQARAMIQAFKDRAGAAATAAMLDAGLGDAAARLPVEVRTTLSRCETPFYEYANELERYNATDHREANVVILRHLEARRKAVQADAVQAVVDVQERGEEALAAGEAAFTAGRFEAARRSLHLARNLIFHDRAQRGRAEQLLDHVDRYRERFATLHADVVAARETGRTAEAYRLGMRLLSELLDSDLTRTVRLPVAISSNPPGAELHLDGELLEARTPCVITYSPFAGTRLDLRVPGRIPQSHDLPSFAQLEADPDAVVGWDARVSIDIPGGARWRVPAARGPFGRLWTTEETPMLLLDDGSAVVPVEMDDGSLGTPRRFRRAQPVRSGGATTGGLEWRIVGHRTLAVLPPQADAWETQALGRLEQAPAVASSMIVFVDELGTAYGYDALAGTEVWRTPLGARPTQPPMASRLGFVIALADGSSVAIDAGTGRVRRLASPTNAYTVVVPHGEGVLILGGGRDGLRRVLADGETDILGDAAVRTGTLPALGPHGAAWIDPTGRAWHVRLGRTTATPIDGFGHDVVGLAMADDMIYGARQGGRVGAVHVDAVDTLRWETALGFTGRATLMPLADDLLVFADGGLAAVAR